MFGGWILQIVLFLAILTAAAVFLGEYMARVYEGRRTFLNFLLRPVENFAYRMLHINPEEEMSWRGFWLSFLGVTFWSIVFLFVLQLFQAYLPGNPDHCVNISCWSALGNAISMVTNTNWAYGVMNESFSHLTKMFGVTVQHFITAALSMTCAVALINSLIRRNTIGLGNFWVYFIRSIIYILLPLALLLAGFLISQGVPNNCSPKVTATTLERRQQILPQGPIAALNAAKNITISGGGYFQADAAHPYENPSPVTDFFNILAVMIIAAAFPMMFGVMLRDRAKGWVIYFAMLIIFCIMLGLVLWAESHGGAVLQKLRLANLISLEGKEIRFGSIASAVNATAATATASGSISAALNSFTPLANLALLFNLVLGIFGGTGSGFVNMMFYIIFTMFLIAIMVGRSPEICGKKLVAQEMGMVVTLLFFPAVIQLLISAMVLTPLFPVYNNQGITAVLFTYISAFKNNGLLLFTPAVRSAFYYVSTAGCMLFGYFLVNGLALRMAGRLVEKNIGHVTTQFAITNLTFVVVLVSLILALNLFSFVPVSVLGPMIDHLKLFIV